jgi:CRP-like cAMP-binding protein
MNQPDTAKLRNFLQQNAAFSPEDLEEACAHFSSRQLKKGEVFVPIGKICKEVAFIAEGALKVWYLNQMGEETVSCFCTSVGLSTAYRSFAQQVPSELGITALVPSHVFVLSYEHFQKLLTTRPVWQALGRNILEQQYLEMEQYASVLNNENAREKYLRILQSTPEIAQLASVADLASYLGVTRRTLSRIRQDVALGK